MSMHAILLGIRHGSVCVCIGMNRKTRWQIHTTYLCSYADISPGDEFYMSIDT